MICPVTFLGNFNCFVNKTWFDTLTLNTGSRTQEIVQAAETREINLRLIDADTIGLSLDETTSAEDIVALWDILLGDHYLIVSELAAELSETLLGDFIRTEAVFTHDSFDRYHS